MPITLKQFLDHPNAGDMASTIVVSYVLGERLNVVNVTGRENRSGPHLLAIGSILEWMNEQSVIWGSGYIKADSPLPAVPKAVLAVRGELTRAKLISQGVHCDPVFGDPGVFIPDIFPRGDVKWSAGFIPHYVDVDDPFVERARAAGLRIINPLSSFATYISELAGCERIITSSLHGLIFAHCYGVPAVWVQLSDRVVGDGFKFRDYYTSVGVRPNDVPNYGTDDPFACLLERCHLPPGRIDKIALRDALLAASDTLRVSWRSRLKAAIVHPFSQYNFARVTSRHQQG